MICSTYLRKTCETNASYLNLFVMRLLHPSFCDSYSKKISTIPYFNTIDYLERFFFKIRNRAYSLNYPFPSL